MDGLSSLLIDVVFLRSQYVQGQNIKHQKSSDNASSSAISAN